MAENISVAEKALQVEEQKAKYNEFTSSLNGTLKNRVLVSEALTTNDANILLPKAITTVVVEAAEGLYLASQFFKEVQLTQGRSMEFIHFGAIRASEVQEGQEYPEQNLDMTKQGLSSVEVRVRKYGLKIAITDEMISDSQWDVIGLHLQAAGRAMARLKEENIFREFSTHGHTVFDGNLFTKGQKGYPTGRGFDGEFNGTLSADDLLDMAISIMASGFAPTDIIMHPLCWSLFAKNEMLEGASIAAFGQGTAGRDPRAFGTSNGLGLNVIFSPFVPIDKITRKFDFYLVDRNNVGVILVKDPISTEQFDNPERDIQSLKLRERYGVGILNGGLGIAVARNVEFKKTWPAPGRTFGEMPLPSDMNPADADYDKDLHDRI